jgi:hypothetical protein
MRLRIGRTIGIAVAVEVLAILVLVVLVATLGPSDPDAAQAYAVRLGTWVGPIAGFFLCLGGGWLVARDLSSGHVPGGLLLGAFVAAIDIAILVGSGARFHPVFLLSNLGRVVAGSLGGWIAKQLRGSRSPPVGAGELS